MDGLSCDRCGKSLLVDERVRYIAELKIYAAYDALELTAADLGKDHTAEIARLLEEIRSRDPEELEDEVARVLKLDLCPACQKGFLKDPLSKNADTAEALLRAIERARGPLEEAAGAGAAKDLAFHATEILLEAESLVAHLKRALAPVQPAAIADAARILRERGLDHARGHAAEIERRFGPPDLSAPAFAGDEPIV